MRHSLETVAAIVAGEGTDPWTFPWWTLRYRDTAAVRAALVKRFAPSTVNRTLSALRTVLKHAWRLGLMDAETYRRAVDVENVRATTLPSGRAVEKDELRALFAVSADDDSPAGRRDAAMLAVLYGGGLRRGELCLLDLGDFDGKACTLTVRGGKGRRQRVVYLNPGACRYLRAWIKGRGGEAGPLFCPVSSTGAVRVTRMRGESLWYILGKRQKQAGLSGITPHGLRRIVRHRAARRRGGRVHGPADGGACGRRDDGQVRPAGGGGAAAGDADAAPTCPCLSLESSSHSLALMYPPEPAATLEAARRVTLQP